MTLEAAAGDTTQPSPAPFNPEVPRISESFRYPAPPVAIAPAGRRANNAARRRLGALTALLCALGLAVAVGPPASAQTTYTWLAKVDETTITHYDVEQRAKLLRFERRDLSPKQARAEARDELIDEALQQQQIKKLETAPPDEEVKKQFEQIAAARAGSVANFLKQLSAVGASRRDLENRLRIQMGWAAILKKRHGSKILPSDSEVEDRLKKAPSIPGGPTIYRIGQMLVDMPQGAAPLQRAVAFQNAQKARDELTSCDKVASLAKQYSRRFPGGVGETVAERIPETFRGEVVSLKEGQNTKPLETPYGFMIFRMCDIKKREARKLGAEEIKQAMVREKLEQLSRLEMNDMRRDALIEFAK